MSLMYARIKSFVVKPRLFERQISDCNYAHFPTLRGKLSPLSLTPQHFCENGEILDCAHIIEKDIDLFSNPLTVDVEGEQEDVQLIKMNVGKHFLI